MTPFSPTIREVAARPVVVPLSPPFRTAVGTIVSAPLVLIVPPASRKLCGLPVPTLWRVHCQTGAVRP